MAVASSGNRGRFDCGPDILFAGRIFASWTRSGEPEAGATAGAGAIVVVAVVIFFVVGIGGWAGCGESIRSQTVNELEGMCGGLRRAKDIYTFWCPIYNANKGEHGELGCPFRSRSELRLSLIDVFQLVARE